MSTLTIVRHDRYEHCNATYVSHDTLKNMSKHKSGIEQCSYLNVTTQVYAINPNTGKLAGKRMHTRSKSPCVVVVTLLNVINGSVSRHIWFYR